MKRFIKLFIILIFFTALCNTKSYSQVYSEADVIKSEKGERLSNMLYVKFAKSNFVSFGDTNVVNANGISNQFISIKNKLSEFCSTNNINIHNIMVQKAFFDAKDSDTLYYNPKTKSYKRLPNLARVFVLRFSKLINIDKLISILENDPLVEYVHGPIQIAECAVYPNDQHYSNGDQWYLNTINAPNAWGISKGSNAIKIALIETSGVELTHQDLTSKIVVSDNNPAGLLNSHGTRVAGFAGASTNNSNVGIASLGWNTKLMTYQPNNDNSDRTVLSQKIKSAADAGADVINLSFRTIKDGFTSCSQGSYSLTQARNYYYNWDYQAVRDAITYAIGKNCVVVASAGNDTFLGEIIPCEDIPYPCYPAEYDNVIAVSGSEQSGNFVEVWNYGSFVDINAPGRTNSSTGLWTTDINNNYTNSGVMGTSFSAPQVSALAALIKSINNDLTPAEIKNIIESTADEVGQYSYNNGRNDYFGYGRINAYEALKYTLQNYGGTILQSVTIPAGETWTIQPGISISFATGSQFVINGTLNANGVTFDRSGSSGNWNGIQFNSGSSGTIQYCTIQNATNGITFNNTGSASITISNCTIQNNSDNGIYTYNSSPIIANNNIYYNSSNGILCNSYSNPKINNNNIKWNSYSGLRCNYYSNPSASLFYYGSGSNVITWNTMYGILASYNCIVNFGSSGGGGNNSIYLNTLDEIYASYGCTVWAQYNYWGTGSTFIPYQSTIYNEYPLPTDPNPGRSVVVVSNSIARAEGVANFSIYDSNISQSSSSISDDDQYDKDITKLKDLLKTEGNTKFGRTALIELEHTYWKSKKTGFEDFINTEILSRKNVKDELTVMVYELINHSYIEKGDFKKAISNLEFIKKELVLNEEIEKNTLYNLGAIYVNCLDDKNSAAIYFDELKQKYPNDRLSFEADALLGNSLPNGNLAKTDGIAKEAENSELDTKLPLSYGLSNCYPNPFNPTTKITYQLPEKSNVVLKIYDALGKEIRTLVNSTKEAGYYSIDFDASGLPSGVYIYQIQAGKFNESKKMLLVK